MYILKVVDFFNLKLSIKMESSGLPHRHILFIKWDWGLTELEYLYLMLSYYCLKYWKRSL